jgi:integrase
MYSWAIREGLCELNPAHGTNNPGEGIQPRDRVLSDEELRIVLTSSPGCPGGQGSKDQNFLAREGGLYTDIIWLLALTGCRRSEITELKWTELDLENGLLLLPAKRVKNRRAFTLPLPNKAIEILKAIPRQEGQEYVFYARVGPFTNFPNYKLRHDARIVLDTGKPLEPWKVHDLRRTVRTGLSRLEIPPHIAERVLNHVKGGIEAVYDKYRYESEMRNALAMWADHVEAVVNGTESNVIPLRKA